MLICMQINSFQFNPSYIQPDLLFYTHFLGLFYPYLLLFINYFNAFVSKNVSNSCEEKKNLADKTRLQLDSNLNAIRMFRNLICRYLLLIDKYNGRYVRKYTNLIPIYYIWFGLYKVTNVWTFQTVCIWKLSFENDKQQRFVVES